MRTLLSGGADPDKKNKYNGQTPLHTAAFYSRLDAAKLLIENGSDVNGKGEKCTPLHIAVANGDSAMVQLLLEKGANPDPGAAGACGLAGRGVALTSPPQFTPLELAQQRHNELLVSMLRSAINRRFGVASGSARNTDEYGPLITSLFKSYQGEGKTIAVAGFSYADGRASPDGNVVSERFTTELINRRALKVVERKEIEKVLGELKLQNAGGISSESAKKVGYMLGADLLVVGGMVELPGNVLELNIRLADVESGEAVAAVTGRVVKDWM
jgi:TolB-like protein